VKLAALNDNNRRQSPKSITVNVTTFTHELYTSASERIMDMEARVGIYEIQSVDFNYDNLLR
jgi:hypothetical protein